MPQTPDDTNVPRRPEAGRRVLKRRPEAGRRVLKRLVTLAGLLSALLLTGGTLSVPGAYANDYTAMLAPSASLNAPAFESIPASSVWAQDSWSAPAGTQFTGFAYTAATFDSANADETGGLSVGFMGSGGSAPADLNFPWTQDCSITQFSSPREWVNDGLAVGLASPAVNGCNTSGNPSGWNFTNVEIESGSPGTNPESTYQTLTLSIWCARDAACNTLDTASTTVTNLSGDIDDPYNQPAGGASWASSTSQSSWYETETGSPALNVSASDPGGVCAIGVYFNGPSSYYDQVTDDSPAMENPGGPGVIGNEFDSSQPCGGGSAGGSVTVPSGIADGTYSLAVVASNPGNWEDGAGLSNAPTIATYNDQINVDDTTPSAGWVDPPSSWTSSTSQVLAVTVGPSGLATLACTDNGNNVAPTLVSGSTSGAGTTDWSVPTTTTGPNAVSCSVANGDTNGPLKTTASRTFDVDTTVPVVSFKDAGYTAGTWTNAPQTVTVTATGGPSGITNTSCGLDGSNPVVVSGPITITGNGRHVLDCTATSNTGVTAESTYDVDIDTEQPTVTLLVDGTDPGASSWFNGTPVVTVIGGEQGGILSGVSQITCSVNGGSSFPLSEINAGDDYTGSFELQQNGANQVSCAATTGAGTVQTTPSTATVNVDNPSYSPTQSSLIDNGNDPFSDGPSQSKWYRTTQFVTVTADTAAGSAPIASISCKGVPTLTGTWTNTDARTDLQGGEQLTFAVPAPGGDLSCIAEDAAGNVYTLGSYLFQIDAKAPTGYFVPRASWPEPDEIEIHADDNGGSGVAVVRVYGQSASVDRGRPQLVGDAQYDLKTGDYVVTVPDGVAPWVAGDWHFYAILTDVAGNQRKITADANGSAEDLRLPLRQNTSVTAVARSVAATQEPAIPTSLAAMALGLGDTGVSVASAERREPEGRTLTVGYGKKVTITGVLRDTGRRGRPVAGAKILIYQEVAGASGYTRLGSAETNAKGRYTYKVRAGASRTLYVVYPGSIRLRPAASALQEDFAGKLTFSASSIPAGGELFVSGKVMGGHVPPGGLEVTIDYREAGAPGSGTLGTVRTDDRGRYRFKQHFNPNTRGLTYELWAVVPGGQPKWPYLKASTGRLFRQVL